ncbi:3-hydroxy acid dehydrogenase/malonic semialdehyde reductase [Dysgonomonas sp. PFB1-18]|uniref:SDR family oxidoreductase n=1 Tax=unclassified Dysgonomonas TaxID=2630389 RepID=UPI00247690DB|nr:MULTISPECIES: SDR family oxidoreductase [unclassified Dysgonomonas]MDH6308361.1 3-hydroxy acid dehydrogenase/malonic semialdehyde reductase [Dysgonomonas sp. PF1-14]MDH6338202.1 3-hydroxy acid dehydrogenase/malonic semialdehyde reductase [Dysgonomonas sp. PF1-16]MDH6379699.1 3-hydroxy acid dehydrogenase/malonic semialdehyde reductase [Dysgonomonas sp. PFB1-18]MDH6397212.1 3-hydroxy acid dehydrogenase/malonic semialdehyde reductase [Dysgonomonas sp. PF1-23]
MKKTALITGATSGLGRAIALRLAKEGYNVIITGRRKERLAELEKEIEVKYESKVYSLCFDVRVYDEVKKSIESLPQEWRTIDILVNNAGLAAGLAPIQEGDIADWEQMIDTNIKGLLYMTRIVSPDMVLRKSGHIINIGSIAGKGVYPNGAVYCATKYAVNALHQGMRMDLLPYNIRVTQICPGAVETEFSLVRFKGDQARADQVYAGYDNLVADDIAEAVHYAVSQPAHVNVQDILIMPTAQATGNMFHREEKK